MAYLAFDSDLHCGSTNAASIARLHTGFTRLERLVIQLACKDGAAAVSSVSRFGRVMRQLFGIPRANPLADTRLETLRIAAGSLWHGNAVLDPAHREALVGEGFSHHQIELLNCHIRVQKRS